MVDKVREVALKVLYNIEVNKAYSNITLDEEINKNMKILDNRDIGFISELTYGVITWKLTIDEIIKKYSNLRLNKISPWILNILRMGIYQIVFLNKVPKSAAVNESVNLAKRYGHKGSSNFVNAILRKVSKNDYEEMFNIENNVERISKTTSMPVWIVETLLKENTLEKVEEICKNSNLKPELSIRVNNLKTSKEELKKKLEEKDIKVENGVLEDFLILKNAKNIENIEEFKNGFFTVQDEAAGLTAKILNPQINDTVLDACSSPGGKTTYLAEIMKDKGEVIAFDIHPHRVKLVEQVSKRLNLKSIKTDVKDSSIYDEKYKEKFDKILLDVPCLGLGVLKRKPDIKWQRKKEDIKEISKIQKQILDTCSKYLKKGGALVYSTCSILKEENEDVVNEFLEENENFEMEKIELEKNNYFKKFCKNNKFLQVYQSEKSDGFFICKMIKKQQKQHKNLHKI